MKKSRYSPQQIAKILKEFDNGKTAAEISREYGISTAAFYKWRERYGGMNGKELKRLKDLEEENRRLKQMYANLSLDHQMAKEIIEKALKPCRKRAIAKELVHYGISRARLGFKFEQKRFLLQANPKGRYCYREGFTTKS